jgi:hypothetical protein
MSYIYALVDLAGNVRYVGKTQQATPLVRLRDHIRDAKAGGRTYLHCWIRSLTAPPRQVVLEVDPPDVDDAERRWIADFRSIGARLCNLTDGGEGIPLGFKHRPEAYAILRGRKLSAEHRQHIGAGIKGQKHTPEAIARMRQSALGKPGTFNGKKHTPEWIEANRQRHLGRKRSAETCRKISEAKKEQNKGTRNPMWGRKRIPSTETRQKISKANIGKQHTAATRLKMSLAQKKRWATR